MTNDVFFSLAMNCYGFIVNTHMKKFILNIEKLFTGETANALVLNQVDEELPTLIPSIQDEEMTIGKWIQESKRVNPNFNPFNHDYSITFTNVNDGKIVVLKQKFLQSFRIDFNNKMSWAKGQTIRHPIEPSIWTSDVKLIELFNQYILDFNLNLQYDFKKRGHQELYLMDDTKWKRPDKEDATFITDKVNMHVLNGQMVEDIDKNEDNDQPIQTIINSSQLNILFPFKKVSSKSLYSEQLTTESPYEIDGKMENSRQLSIQGKDTLEKCIQGIASVGGNLYVMSPLIESKIPNKNLIANGITIVNSFIDEPYNFPHTMTLFQPSGERYKDVNLAKDEYGLTSFITWYENHNRKTVLSIIDDYGGNVSNLNLLGIGSYELELATYSPTGIRLDNNNSITTIPLNTDEFRKLRSVPNKYKDFISQDEDGNYIHSKKYILDNGDVSTIVGLDFNLYDNFITGNERIIRLTIPKDKDFNQLHLRFKCDVHHKETLLGEYEYIVYVDDYEAYRLESNNVNNSPDPNIDICIKDTILKAHNLDIKIIVHYQVDFSKRNNEKEYQDLLKNSGIALMDIRIDNDVTSSKKQQLSFADYVNEVGISDDEHKKRYSEFWEVSQYKKDIPYQLVIETPLKNMTTSGIPYPNNYSTGDIYGDVFATKSMLDSNYNMNLSLDIWNDRDNRWATEEEKTANERKKIYHLTNMIHAIGREYINIGQCSSQLFLVFKPTDMAIGYENKWKDVDGDNELDPDNRIISRNI